MKSTEGPADWGGEKLVRLARILHANPGSPEWHPPLDDLLDLAVSELANPGHVAKLNIHLATCKSCAREFGDILRQVGGETPETCGKPPILPEISVDLDLAIAAAPGDKSWQILQQWKIQNPPGTMKLLESRSGELTLVLETEEPLGGLEYCVEAEEPLPRIRLQNTATGAMGSTPLDVAWYEEQISQGRRLVLRPARRK